MMICSLLLRKSTHEPSRTAELMLQPQPSPCSSLPGPRTPTSTGRELSFLESPSASPSSASTCEVARHCLLRLGADSPALQLCQYLPRGCLPSLRSFSNGCKDLHPFSSRRQCSYVSSRRSVLCACSTDVHSTIGGYRTSTSLSATNGLALSSPLPPLR
jgi:hypothetical protein